MKKIYRFLPLLLAVGVCGCTAEPGVSLPAATVTTTATEATTVPESEAPPSNLLSREEVVEIVGDLLERSQKLDRFLMIEYQMARDESGFVIIYDGDGFTAKEAEEDLSGEWVEIVESEYTKTELMNLAKELYTEKAGDYTFYFIRERLHEENDKLYRRLSDPAMAHLSFYPETLEIGEQTESLISIECEGFNETYEQQLFVSLTTVLEDGVWKIDALSYR